MTLRQRIVRVLGPRLRPTPCRNGPRHVQHASTTSSPPSYRIRNLIYGSSTILILAFGYAYVTDARASIHQYVAPRLLRLLYPDAEDAHHAGTKLLKELYKLGLGPRERGAADADGKLSIELFGHQLANPVGISGGLDKNAEIPDALFALGAGVVEIGGVTPLPQDGNPRPRVFRLASQNAIINRYGLNSEGADVVAMRLRQRVRKYAYSQGYGIDEDAERFVLDGEAGIPPGSLVPGKLLAVQIAKNKSTPDDDLEAVIWDHVYCVDRLGKYADILVVNVSSPNTPGLRSLQSKLPLTRILTAVVDAANVVPRKNKPAVMVKVSPDENSESQIRGICDAVWESGVAGVIVGNTTTKRPDPLPAGYQVSAEEAKLLRESGGYSGPQLFERTLDLIGKYRKTLDQGPSQNTDTNTNTTPTISSPSPPQKAASDTTEAANIAIMQKIEESTKRDEANLKPMDPKSATGRGSGGREIGTGIEIPQRSIEEHPLLRLPERNNPFTSSGDVDVHSSDDIAPVAITTQSASEPTLVASLVPPAPSAPAAPQQRRPWSEEAKVIFASGGITNGEQALQVLNAGSSVAMCYTAFVYGGVGTVVRIKNEMREKISK